MNSELLQLIDGTPQVELGTLLKDSIIVIQLESLDYLILEVYQIQNVFRILELI